MKTLRQQSFILISILFCATNTQAQYYISALGKNGTQLKTALHNIIKGHLVGTYADLWNSYYTTDVKGSNQVWDIYSDIPGGVAPYTYTLGTNQCGTYNSEGDCYNREHTWPDNYFGGGPPMHTDLQHIFPTDGHVNGKRGSLPYGKVNIVSWTSQNGSKIGNSNTYPISSSDVFEPIDSFKGDLARVYFYMSTRYEGEDAGWLNWEMANGAVLTPDAVSLLLTWHHLDPVSQKEIDRNNAAFLIQGHRNPFIDYPMFADCIWGASDCTSLNASTFEWNDAVQLYPNPVSNTIYFKTGNLKINAYTLFNFQGQLIMNGKFLDHGLSIESLVAGSYLLLLNTDHGLVKKILIKD